MGLDSCCSCFCGGVMGTEVVFVCVCGHDWEDHGDATGRCKHPHCGCLKYRKPE